MTTDSFLLDKSVFVGVNKEKLCGFVRTHTVILPETLFYECYTSDQLREQKYLEQLGQLIKAGAYLSYQLIQIVADEGKNLRPRECVIDHYWTKRLSSGRLRKEDTITKEEIDKKKTIGLK